MKKLTHVLNNIEPKDKAAFNESFEYLLSSTSQEWIDGLIALLKVAFCEEMNAWYGYIIAKHFLVGGERRCIADFYDETAKDEYDDHAEWILERLNQLNANIDDIDSPSTWATIAVSHPYVKPVYPIDDTNIEDHSAILTIDDIRRQINAEEAAIETYNAIISYCEDKDWVTKKKCKEILADEVQHKADLIDFLKDIEANCNYCGKSIKNK